jgi:ABC-2 type transport system permease protein
MKTMKWLLRREFWEHKGAFFWAPAVVALAMVVFMGGMLVYGITSDHIRDVKVMVNGEQVHTASVAQALHGETRKEVASVAANNYLAAAAPLFVVLPVVVFFYCLAALADDRRDRSILFWKSLPISDQMTVLSKVATALIVAPMITIAIGTATALGLLVLGGIMMSFKGVDMFGPLLANPNLYLAPAYLVGLLPVYILWAIPTVGWLLMVSSWARSKVLLWAVGTPLIVVALLKWFNVLVAQYSDTVIDTNWFIHNVVLRGLGGLIPGIWMPFSIESPKVLASPSHHGMDLTAVFTQSWMSLGKPDVWVGVIAGAAMIFVAIRLRRWRDEG